MPEYEAWSLKKIGEAKNTKEVNMEGYMNYKFIVLMRWNDEIYDGKRSLQKFYALTGKTFNN